jgi:hypothetical protein
MHASKYDSFRVRALRRIMVHDMLSEYYLDFERAMNRALECCSWGSRASPDENQGAIVC